MSETSDGSGSTTWRLAHLGVGRDSVYRWVEHRGLPGRKVGRLLRFRLSEVDAWVEAGGGAGRGLAGPAKRSAKVRHKKSEGR